MTPVPTLASCGKLGLPPSSGSLSTVLSSKNTMTKFIVSYVETSTLFFLVDLEGEAGEKDNADLKAIKLARKNEETGAEDPRLQVLPVYVEGQWEVDEASDEIQKLLYKVLAQSTAIARLEDHLEGSDDDLI